MIKKSYCTICGKSQVNPHIENKEVKSDIGYVKVDVVRICCCGKLQTIRIYDNNDDKTDNKTA